MLPLGCYALHATAGLLPASHRAAGRPLCPLTKLTGTNKRDVLLCPRYGLTCVNLGTNAYIAGLLAMYKVPVTCLQTIKQPVSHRAAGLLRNLFHGLKRDFIGTPQVPPQLPKVFAEYIELLEDGGAANQPQLAKRLKANSKRAAEIMTKEMTERLEAYMPTLLALEVIGEQFLHCLFLHCLSPLSLPITALCFVNRSERIER